MYSSVSKSLNSFQRFVQNPIQLSWCCSSGLFPSSSSSWFLGFFFKYISQTYFYTSYNTLGYTVCEFSIGEKNCVKNFERFNERWISNSGPIILLIEDLFVVKYSQGIKFAFCAALLFLHYCVWRSGERACAEKIHTDCNGHSRIPEITAVFLE